MFSGIIEIVGIIKNIIAVNDCMELTIAISHVLADLSIGESIAVNGVCLTLTHFVDNTLSVTVVPETLRITRLGQLIVGSPVNIERSLKLSSRLGGHYVQGHVDGIGEIIALQTNGDRALLAKISLPTPLAKYVVNKGYITLDGMSITVIHAEDNWFTVTFIPHTKKVTIVNQYSQGTKINIEVDIVGKYIEKLLGVYAK